MLVKRRRSVGRGVLKLALSLSILYLTYLSVRKVYEEWMFLLAKTAPFKSPYWLDHLLVVAGGLFILTLIVAGAALLIEKVIRG